MYYKSTSYDIEAVIQAKLYVVCRKAYLHCALEYLYEDCRFDLVVIEHNQVISIVEVKTPILLSQPVERSGQIVKYKKYGIPVFILYSIYDIPYLVKRLVEVRKKFLESTDPTKVKCFEADRRNEKKWDRKISEAFSKFDETFPDYRFTNEYSLEHLAIGVKVLGLKDVLKLMDDYIGDSVENFFFVLNNQVQYTRSGPSRFLNERKWNVKTCRQYEERQDRIDEKLS